MRRQDIRHEPTAKERHSSGEEMTWLKDGKYGIFLTEPLHHQKNVYRGKRFFDEFQWQSIAIKTMQRRKEHAKETALINALQHPNIVSVFDWGTYKGLFNWTYIVMELCDQDLDQYMIDNRRNPVNIPRCFSYTKQILDGLHYLHGMKIVHLDLKPANVLIDLAGQKVKIADFGISQQLEGEDETRPETSLGYGSDEFKAPEYLRNDPALSYPADIFSFGIVACYIYTNGRHPFGEIRYRWAGNIIDNKNMDLSIIPKIPELPSRNRKQLISLLEKALEHEASHRPTTEVLIQHPFFLGASARTRTKSTCIDNFSRQNSHQLEDSNNLDDALKAALGEMMSEHGKVEHSIQRVKDVITIYKPYSGKAIRKIADEYNKGDLQQKIQSLILYQISFDVYKQERHEPDDSAHWIIGLVKDVRLAAYDLAMKTDVRREIAIRFGITFASSLLNAIRGIRNISEPVKLLAEAECHWHIGNVYFRVGNYKASIKFLKIATEFYTKCYKEKVFKDDHYCVSLWVIGNCYFRLKKFDDAERYYSETVSAVKKTDELSDQWFMIVSKDLAKAKARLDPRSAGKSNRIVSESNNKHKKHRSTVHIS